MSKALSFWWWCNGFSSLTQGPQFQSWPIILTLNSLFHLLWEACWIAVGNDSLPCVSTSPPSISYYTDIDDNFVTTPWPEDNNSYMQVALSHFHRHNKGDLCHEQANMLWWTWSADIFLKLWHKRWEEFIFLLCSLQPGTVSQNYNVGWNITTCALFIRGKLLVGWCMYAKFHWVCG
jgi:hypothetical protein